MATPINVFGIDQPNLRIPDDFELVAADIRTRNGEPVRVERYQHHGEVDWLGRHLTLVWGNDGRLLSYNDFSLISSAPLPTRETARDIAVETLRSLDPLYARGLHYMRTDALSRSFVNTDRAEVQIPILWVKFAHNNGSYNWVSVGAGGEIVEFERESQWDYARARRATEEWNYDDWVLAHMGQGPQPAAPAALA